MKERIDYLFSKVKDLDTSTVLVTSQEMGSAVETRLPATFFNYFAFGFTIAAAVVTVLSGKVRHGTRTPITVAQTNVTVGQDNLWIFVVYVSGSGSATIASSTTEPVSSAADSTFRTPLYLVTLTSGVASIGSGNIKHLGDILIPGEFA